MSLNLKIIITDYILLLQLTLVGFKKQHIDYFPFFPAAKNKVVQLSVVRCQLSQIKAKSGSKNKKSHTKRSSIQDCYRRTEVWSLQDLTLVDGRDPDVVILLSSAPTPFFPLFFDLKGVFPSFFVITLNHNCAFKTTCYHSLRDIILSYERWLSLSQDFYKLQVHSSSF